MNLVRRVLPLVVMGVLGGGNQLVRADTERRDLEGFTEIAVSNGIAVELRQGDAFAVEVEADDTDDIVTEVVGDTLRIYRDEGWKWWSFGLISLFMGEDELKASVTLPQLTRVRATDSAEVRGAGRFTGANLELRSSGGSAITLDLAYDALDARSSGGSRMHLSGTAHRGMLTSSGGSRQDNEDLAINDAELRASGGSTVNVGVVAELQARASGGSDIRYDGDPRVRDIDESGGADVTRR